MAAIVLRAPLSELCGGRVHTVPGATAVEALRALERERPAIAGWILDEHGRVREHVNIYVNGERCDGSTPVGESDRVQVLPAITGG